MTPRPVELRLFGGVQVLASGVEVRSGLRQRARSLLVRLAVRPGGLTADELLEDIWHEAGGDAGIQNVYTVVSHVRTTLRPLVGRRTDVIVSVAERYQLSRQDVDVDVWRFESALAEASTAADDQSRMRALERAALEVTGEPLEGLDYEWAEPVRERLRRRAIDTLAELCDARGAADDISGAIEVVETAVRLEPGSEELYGRLMRLHKRAGRPDAALRAYRQCALELRELGVEPDVAMKAILDAAHGSPAACSPRLDDVVRGSKGGGRATP